MILQICNLMITFSMILCSHVLDDKKAMKEFFRVLKPRGWVILLVPIDTYREKTFGDPTIISPKDREFYLGQEDHARIYGCDFKDKLRQVGFIVKVKSYLENKVEK